LPARSRKLYELSTKETVAQRLACRQTTYLVAQRVSQPPRENLGARPPFCP